MLTIKLLLNSIVSMQGAKFMTIDIKDFYFNTPMARPEFMRLKINDLPESIIEQYKLRDKVTKDGYMYVQINKGMYGLPQAGIIAQELLEKKTQCSRVSAKHNYTWFLEAWLPTNLICIICLQLRSEICWRRECQSPFTNIEQNLQNFIRMGRHKIYHINFRMGLHQLLCTRLHSRVLLQSLSTFPTQYTQKATVSTISTCWTVVWSQTAICTKRWPITNI